MEGLASLDELLVALGLGVVLLLGGLVSKGVLAGGEAGADGGIGVLSDLLVGLCGMEREKKRSEERSAMPHERPGT